MKIKLFIIIICLIPLCLEINAINSVKGDSLFMIAEDFARQKNWEKAAEYYIKSSECFYDERDVNYSYINCLCSAGCSYYCLQDYSTAINYLDMSFQSSRRLLHTQKFKESLEPTLLRILIVAYNNLYNKKRVNDELYQKIKNYCIYYLSRYKESGELGASVTDILAKAEKYLDIEIAACQFAEENQQWLDCIEFAEQGIDYILNIILPITGSDINQYPGMVADLGLFIVHDLISSASIGCYNNIKESVDYNYLLYRQKINGDRNEFVFTQDMQDGALPMLLLFADIYHGLRDYNSECDILNLVSKFAAKYQHHISAEDMLVWDYYKARFAFLTDPVHNSVKLHSFLSSSNNPIVQLECTNLICNYYMTIKNYNKAYDYILNLPDSILLLNQGSLLMLDFYTKKAECEMQLGDYKTAKKTILFYNHFLTNQVKSDFPKLISHNRQDYLEGFGYWFSHTLPYFATILKDESINTACYNGILLYRNALLESEANLLRISRTSIDPTIEYQLYELNNKRREKLNNPIVSEDSLEFLMKKYLFDFDLSRKEKRAIDLANSHESLISDFMTISGANIKDKLTQDGIAIEFFNIESNNDEKIIYALTLKKGYSSPHLVRVCNQSDIEGLDINQFISVAYDKIWKPFASELLNVNYIYFSVDGILHSYPIEYALMPNGATINRKFSCLRLSSTRSIINMQRDNHDYESAFLIGNVDYNANFEKVRNYIEVFRDNNKQKIHDIEYVQTVESTYDSRTSMIHNIWDDLNTDEIGEIEMILKKNGIKSELFSSFEASEDLMKTLSFRGIDLLHFSTHGLYVQPSQYSRYPYLTFINSDANPMNCSMLLMAGVNNLIKNGRKNKNVCDGLLLASDIADLNLNDVDLVVLSTCDSGLGSITSDGVWGMQRGFKQAGCNTILMSLSEVDKEATCFFMESFYRNLFIFKSKQKALYEAQKEMRESEDYNEPSQWASFILLDAN